jgi:endo-1,4-beta-D-glucanase Y
MDNLQVFFDSLLGYLVGMAFIEAILKPAIVRWTKKALKKTDESMNDLLPNWMWDETESD